MTPREPKPRRLLPTLLMALAALLSCSGGDESGRELHLYVSQMDMPFGDSRIHIYRMPRLDYLGKLPANKICARMAVLESRSQIWASGEASGDIQILDTKVDSVLRRVRFDLPMSGGAFDPEQKRFLVTHGAVIVSERSEAKATLVDVETMESLATFDVGLNPRAACFGPEGRFAYIANTGNGTLTKIDVTGLTVAGSIPTGPGAHHVSLDPAGRWLYVACLGTQVETGRDTGALWVHSLPDLELLAKIPAGQHPSRATPTPTGDLLVVNEMWRRTGEQCRVRLFRVGDGAELDLDLWKEIEAGENPLSGGMSPDGRWFAVTDFNRGAVAVLDLKKGRRVAEIDLPVNSHENFSVDAVFAWHGDESGP
jgi:DNA-binding beta-propeller fold protein YncE